MSLKIIQICIYIPIKQCQMSYSQGRATANPCVHDHHYIIQGLYAQSKCISLSPRVNAFHLSQLHRDAQKIIAVVYNKKILRLDKQRYSGVTTYCLQDPDWRHTSTPKQLQCHLMDDYNYCSCMFFLKLGLQNPSSSISAPLCTPMPTQGISYAL